jgi:hypothetical protein
MLENPHSLQSKLCYQQEADAGFLHLRTCLLDFKKDNGPFFVRSICPILT